MMRQPLGQPASNSVELGAGSKTQVSGKEPVLFQRCGDQLQIA